MQDLLAVGSVGSKSLHASLRPAADAERALIDLRQATFVDPAGLVAIACFAHRQRATGRSVECRSPVEAHVANYAARAHLGRVLDELGATHDLPVVREFDVGDNLMPVRSFDSSDGADDLAQHVWAQVEPIDQDAAAAIYTALVATGENVGAHSGQGRGYMAAQKTYGGRLLRFAVADAGRGFRRSLAHLSPTSDSAALRLALQPGVSGIEGPGRGLGLPEMVDRLTKIDGALHLLSGSGRLHVRSGRPPNATEAPNGFHGSVLEGEIPLTS